MHSSDTTGAQSESDWPLYDQLFGEFFAWKATNLPTPGHDRDIHLCNEHRHQAQSIAGA
jgi:hypothetical protein